MSTKTHHGFTVIETMLFLAVSGVLAIGILVSSGIAISQERYRDSVTSLKSFLQQQYAEVTSVVNSRDSEWRCTDTGAVVPGGAADFEARGASECVLLGRYITIDETGTLLTASNVVAYRIPGADVAVSDLAEIMTNYRLGASPIDQEKQQVAWGSQIVKPKPASFEPQPLSILIIRSPLSGALMTFSMENVQTNINTLVNDANRTTARNLCVNADAGSFMGDRIAVRLTANATSQGSVEVVPESERVCD